MSIRIYVEGGAPGALAGSCRKAFSAFFGKVVRPNAFKVIACGSRQSAFEMFRLAIKTHSSDRVLLLVDSEDQVVNSSVWKHLADRVGDGWARPDGAADQQAHLMSQVMESWFLADPDAIARYFGSGFQRSALPRRQDVESISKPLVYAALDKAVKHTLKGEYRKGRDSFALLEKIDPALVRASAPHAERLLAELEKLVAPA